MVGDGVSGTRHVTMRGFGKPNSAQYPYCVANEYVASRLGILVGLPIPPGAVVTGPSSSGSNQDRAWVTLAFRPTGEKPPPIDPPAVVASLPRIAAGLVIFDLLIANEDRHSGNLAFIAHPPRLDVFDHSHALFGPSTDGPSRLAQVRDRLVIDGSPLTNRQCLLNHLKLVDDIRHWVAEIQGLVSDAHLKLIGHEVNELGLVPNRAESDSLVDFLTHRRDALETLIEQNKSEFKGIPADAWGIPI